ncbi:spectrin beta chain, non-erythrocytic 5-like isoform X4 [Ascaphus truei]|uniref:spectrin beta chain, non-erythrocytic 5-like isoform X4 n=1 Tax=Ascaphus truei TaxID=8439 RepID=UPI003F599960
MRLGAFPCSWRAETWVRGKLRDLKDGCDICPLRDRYQASQTLQRDVQGSESTLVKLSQMEDHLTRSQSSTESTRTQLYTLKDQWQLLKQTATNQSKALGGGVALQEFNKKADELEMWMREKDEKPSLERLLDENNDKVQLTRRILDLKQEQQHYRNLQENINSLAQKLEKQGKAGSKGTSTRRKHLNKMWLRLQDTVQEHHDALRLALEAAAFSQQADTVLRAMEGEGSIVCVMNGGEGRGDRDVRDIASQIMMLDVTVSQVSSLHPVLATQASHIQHRVKERWAQLQQALRNERPGEAGRPPTPCTEEQSSVGTQQGMLGNLATVPRRENGSAGIWEVKEERRDCEARATTGRGLSKRRRNSLESRERVRKVAQNEAVLRASCPGAPEVSRLLDELSSTKCWLQSLEGPLSEPTAMRSPELIRRDLCEVAVLEREVESRGLALHSLGERARGPVTPKQSMSEETEGKVQEVEERFRSVQDALRRRTSDLQDTLVLSEFLKIVQMEEDKRNREMSEFGGGTEGPSDTGTGSGRRDMFTPLEELQEAVEMLNDAVRERQRVVAVTKETESLECQLSVVSRMILSVQSRLDELRRDTEEAECEFAVVKRQRNLRDLQGLFIQQQELEADLSGALRLDVRRLEEQADRLQELCPERMQGMGMEIQGTLQAWSQLQETMQGLRCQLQRTSQLRAFFQDYLAMVSWTEDIRAQIFSEGPGSERLPAQQREKLERGIEGKLREFEELASVGWKFIGGEHFLTPTIKESMEELQGMLSWVLMRWRCQKQQRIMGDKMDRRKPKALLPEAGHVLKEELAPADTHQITSSIPRAAFEPPKDVASFTCASPPARAPGLRRYGRRTHSPMSLQNHLSQFSVGTEWDNQLGTEQQEETPAPETAEGPVWLPPKEPAPGEETGEEELYTLRRRLDFQLMEGPLEKKHMLQQRGRKASCRTWTLYHAVLVRRTLCFYHDRKHTAKSTVAAPPLHLTGAVCSPATTYTKRPHCLRLQLPDGSEFLLRAPSSSLLQQWVSKLQHNSGLEDPNFLGDPVLAAELSSPGTTRHRDAPTPGTFSARLPELCQPTPVYGRETLNRGLQAHRDHKELPNLRDGCRASAPSAGRRLPYWYPAPSPRTSESCGQEDVAALGTNRRRSQSFSSATYQNASPSYSVTLYIGDPLSTRGRSHSFATGPEESQPPQHGWNRDGSHAGGPKPRSKSVFRKIFRKKE